MNFLRQGFRKLPW